MGDPAASDSAFTLIACWFTPFYLFVIVNLVIVTIAIITRFATPKTQLLPPPHDHDDSPQRLVRSPSLLGRVMSFDLGLHKYDYEPTREETQSVDDSPQLVRAPSLLERVNSFNLGLCKTEHRRPENESPRPRPNPDDPKQQPEQLARTPSILERLKSAKFYRTQSIEEKKEPEIATRKCEDEKEEEEGVDAKADDFINRFKEQLRLQRLDSILRYRQMLKAN